MGYWGLGRRDFSGNSLFLSPTKKRLVVGEGEVWLSFLLPPLLLLELQEQIKGHVYFKGREGINTICYSKMRREVSRRGGRLKAVCCCC